MTVFYLNIFSNAIYSCHAKPNFQHHYEQSSVSHDPAEIILICWFGAQKYVLLLSVLKTIVLFNIEFEESIIIFQHLFELLSLY